MELTSLDVYLGDRSLQGERAQFGQRRPAEVVAPHTADVYGAFPHGVNTPSGLLHRGVVRLTRHVGDDDVVSCQSERENECSTYSLECFNSE